MHHNISQTGDPDLPDPSPDRPPSVVGAAIEPRWPAWQVSVRRYPGPRIVPFTPNYDRRGYQPERGERDRR